MKLEIVSSDWISLAESSYEKVLGVTINLKLKFENYITELCLKAVQKLNPLCLISNSMLEKRRTIMKAFIESVIGLWYGCFILGHWIIISFAFRREHWGKYILTINHLSMNSLIRMALRSSCPDVFCEKGVLRKIPKLTGKHLCQTLCVNKVAGLQLH